MASTAAEPDLMGMSFGGVAMMATAGYRTVRHNACKPVTGAVGLCVFQGFWRQVRRSHLGFAGEQAFQQVYVLNLVHVSCARSCAHTLRGAVRVC